MKKLYICNIENPVDHCRNHCPCGKPHRPEDCTKSTYCGIVDADTACRPLTEKEKKHELMKFKLTSCLTGVYWLQCPVCEKYFGRHELTNTTSLTLISEDGIEHPVCPDPECRYKANKSKGENA